LTILSHANGIDKDFFKTNLRKNAAKANMTKPKTKMNQQTSND
jgi:hypothetical protein